MNISQRPRVKPRPTFFDKTIETAGWAVLVGCWILVAGSYSSLPQIIPIHYNAAGTPDGFGAKTALWLLLVVDSVLFVGMTILNRYPRIFNYLVPITPENALRQYTLATRLMRWVKLGVVLIFGGIIWKTIRIVGGEADELGFGISVLLGLLVAGVLGYVVVSWFRKSSK